eukprot:10818072-Lingulodinium_polyedra.AAC.1
MERNRGGRATTFLPYCPRAARHAAPILICNAAPRVANNHLSRSRIYLANNYRHLRAQPSPLEEN